MGLKFYSVNAFTHKAFEGTQVLVFPDADNVDDTTMLNLSKEFGFPDTVFITKSQLPGCAARFRLFNKSGETDFEGHPTIAAANVLFTNGFLGSEEIPRSISIEEGIGTITIDFQKNSEGGLVTEFVVNTQAKFDTYVPSYNEICRILSLDTKSVQLDTFTPLVTICEKSYLIIPVKNSTVLQQARFSLAAWVSSASTSTLPRDIFLFAPLHEGDNSEFHARLVGENIMPEEDPPIGSAMPAFANYLIQSDINSREFLVKRGVGHNRLSTLSVRIDNLTEATAKIRVGGQVTPISQGELLID